MKELVTDSKRKHSHLADIVTKILHLFECSPMCLLQMGTLRKDHSEFLHHSQLSVKVSQNLTP